MAVSFEGYERRIDKINKTLAEYGIADLEEALKICTDLGFNPYEITVKNGAVLAKYKSGMEQGYKLVTLDITGQLLSIRNQ